MSIPDVEVNIYSEGTLEGEIGVADLVQSDNYEDLQNLPSVNGHTLIGDQTSEELGIDIPTKTSDLENDSDFVTSQVIANDYNPESTYNTGDYVIYQGGLYICNTDIETPEEWNAENWTLINLVGTIPTKTSDLENDSNFATTSDIPTKTSDLDNDSGFAVIDDTVTANDKAWSSGKISGELSELRYYKDVYTQTRPANTWTSGYYWGKTAYSNSSYAYSSFLNVSGGDIVTVFDNAQFRFVEVYNSNGDIIDSISSFVKSYIVPTGAVSMVLTVQSSNVENKYPIVDVFSIETCFKRNKGYANYYSYWNSVTSGDLLILVSHIDNKKNCEYFFTGKFTSFTSLEIGHGRTSGIYCVIDNTNITVYGSGNQVQQFAHGLTLTDFITVSIKCGDIANARGSVTIQTNGGYYRKDDNFIFTGCNDNIYWISQQSMTDCEFEYAIMDSRKDVFVFGDSYISLADSKKWVNYAIKDNDNNMLLCGYSGAKSTDEIIPFRKLNEQRNPLYVGWFLGMNDGDNGAVNADWKKCVDEVIEYCNNHNITPILATIPNVPNIDHTYKNAYVKASGYRYVDFAKAVNAESAGATWYTGMLGSDNVHPTEAGAKALWLRAILDFPELIN